MKRVSDDLEVLEALEKNDMLTDNLLDCETFYGEHTMIEEFSNALEELIMEQAIAIEKLRNEHSYFFEYLSVHHWKELAKGKCSPKASMPMLPYLVNQFRPMHPRRNNYNVFSSNFQVIKNTNQN